MILEMHTPDAYPRLAMAHHEPDARERLRFTKYLIRDGLYGGYGASPNFGKLTLYQLSQSRGRGL